MYVDRLMVEAYNRDGYLLVENVMFNEREVSDDADVEVGQRVADNTHSLPAMPVL